MKERIHTSGYTPLCLTPEQITAVISNLVASWSPLGLAKNYDIASLEKIATVFTEAVEIAKKETP